MLENIPIQRLVLFGVLLVIVVFLILPLQFTNQITFPAKLLPAEEWYLMKNRDGSLNAVHHNHRDGMVQSYQVIQVERGDAFRYSIATGLTDSQQIAAGDTLGRVSSNYLRREIARLQGELSTMQAELESGASAAKQSLIEEAEQQVALAKARYQTQQAILERQRELFEKGLISRETFEVTESTARVYEKELGAARARVRALQTGEKPEQLAIYKNEIQRLKTELKTLQHLGDQHMLTAPIPGNLYRPNSSDTLLVIESSRMIVAIAADWKYRQEISADSEVKISLPSRQDPIYGSIYRFEHRNRVVGNQQVFPVFASLGDTTSLGTLPSHLFTTCEITGLPVTPMSYVTSAFRKIFSQ